MPLASANTRVPIANGIVNAMIHRPATVKPAKDTSRAASHAKYRRMAGEAKGPNDTTSTPNIDSARSGFDSNCMIAVSEMADPSARAAVDVRSRTAGETIAGSIRILVDRPWAARFTISEIRGRVRCSASATSISVPTTTSSFVARHHAGYHSRARRYCRVSVLTVRTPHGIDLITR